MRNRAGGRGGKFCRTLSAPAAAYCRPAPRILYSEAERFLTVMKRRETIVAKIYKTGEKPGSGTYSCTNCGTDVTLGQDDKMPPCPKCTNNEFTRE